VRVGRTAALAIGVLAALGLGWWMQERWPDSRAALDCPRSESAGPAKVLSDMPGATWATPFPCPVGSRSASGFR
jgi:hypothetical protein